MRSSQEATLASCSDEQRRDPHGRKTRAPTSSLFWGGARSIDRGLVRNRPRCTFPADRLAAPIFPSFPHLIASSGLSAAPQHVFYLMNSGTTKLPWTLTLRAWAPSTRYRSESIERISASCRRMRTRGEFPARGRKGHMEPDGCTMVRVCKTGRRRVRGRAIPNRSGQIEAP